MSAEIKDILERAARYGNTSEINARAHYLSSEAYGQWSKWLGIPAALLAAIIGTAVFSTLQQNPDTWIKIIVGLVSLLSAILSTLQTFLNYSERSQDHKEAGAFYSSLRRSFEIFVLRYTTKTNSSRDEAVRSLEDLEKWLTKSAQDYPTISDARWAKAYKEVYGREYKPSPITLE